MSVTAASAIQLIIGSKARAAIQNGADRRVSPWPPKEELQQQPVISREAVAPTRANTLQPGPQKTRCPFRAGHAVEPRALATRDQEARSETVAQASRQHDFCVPAPGKPRTMSRFQGHPKGQGGDRRERERTFTGACSVLHSLPGERGQCRCVAKVTGD